MNKANHRLPTNCLVYHHDQALGHCQTTTMLAVIERGAMHLVERVVSTPTLTLCPLGGHAFD
jgi:hypothetical protein